MKGNNISPHRKAATYATTQEPSLKGLGPGSSLGCYLVCQKATESSISPISGSSRSLISLGARRTPISRRSPRSGGSNHPNSRYHDKKPSTNYSSPVSTELQILNEWNGSSMLDGPSENEIYPTQHPADPPRPARDGLEWVWFPEGYWAEREVRDLVSRKCTQPLERPRWWNRGSSERNKSKSTSQQSVSDNNTPPLADLPKIGSAKTLDDPSTDLRRSGKLGDRTAKGHKSSKEPPYGFQFIRQSEASDRSPDEDIDAVDEQLGLYCRAKKNIRTRLLQRPNMSRANSDEISLRSAEGSTGLASRTTLLLECAAGYFDRMHQEHTDRNGRLLSPGTPLTPASPGRRAFGHAPWHRRNSNESILSVSSSVHRLLRGKTPAATPVLKDQYTLGGKEVNKVDISSQDPNEPTFLPSEARRIDTPPMSLGTATVQVRDTIFDLSLPEQEVDSEGYTPTSPHTSTGSGSGATSVTAKNSRPAQWSEADTKRRSRISKPFCTKSSKQGFMSDIESSSFELKLPDHLPNSPLCPKNPKHKSEGTGVCVDHGQKRRNVLKNMKRPTTGESEST